MRAARPAVLAAVLFLPACGLLIGISDIVPAPDAAGVDAAQNDATAHVDARHKDAGSAEGGRGDATVGEDGPDSDTPVEAAPIVSGCDGAAGDAGQVITLVCSLHHPSAIAVAGGSIFWGDDDNGLGVLTNGATLRREAVDGPVSEVTTNDHSVLWVANAYGYVEALDGGPQAYAVIPHQGDVTHTGASGLIECWTQVGSASVNFGWENDAGPSEGSSGGVLAAATSIFVTSSNPTIFMTAKAPDGGSGFFQLYYTNNTPLDSVCNISLGTQSQPGPIVAAAGRAFWLDKGTTPESIVAVNPGAPPCSGTPSTFVASASGDALAATATMLYWATDGGIMRTPIGAVVATPEPFVSGLPGSPQRIAVDGDGWIYWTESSATSSGAIRRAHE